MELTAVKNLSSGGGLKVEERVIVKDVKTHTIEYGYGTIVTELKENQVAFVQIIPTATYSVHLVYEFAYVPYWNQQNDTLKNSSCLAIGYLPGNSDELFWLYRKDDSIYALNNSGAQYIRNATFRFLILG